AVPDDPAYPRQWAYPAINAPDAWDKSVGAASVRVAVLDTGADSSHPDLQTKLDIVAGSNMLTFGALPEDDNGHGTHIAGIIGAATDNALAVAGTAWQARIMPIKVLDRNGGGDDAVVVAGMNFAVSHGARVINLSFGGCDDSAVLRDTVANALAMGVVVVAAGGNYGGTHDDPANTPCATSDPRYPAAYPGVVGVASVNRNLQRSSFSVAGPWIAVAAPGGEATVDQATQGIVSTWPQKFDPQCDPACTRAESGTSAATAFVSGAVALLLSAQPTLSPADVLDRIEASAQDLGPPGVDPYYGAGLLDLDALLTIRPSDQILTEGATAGGFDEWVLLA